jgi:hypothetical protein
VANDDLGVLGLTSDETTYVSSIFERFLVPQFSHRFSTMSEEEEIISCEEEKSEESSTEDSSHRKLI